MRRSSAFFFFFALLFALLFSTPMVAAGRQRSFSTDQHSPRLQQGEGQVVVGGGEDQSQAQVHGGRMPKAAAAAVATSDYGSYDPSPAMNKPHFKLIPN